MNEGILLIDKPAGMTSFDVVHVVRKRLQVQTVGHAGTLDPFATGLLVILVGREYTKRSNEFMMGDKEYHAKIQFGSSTTTYDPEGEVTATSSRIPSKEEIVEALKHFSGEFHQIPPMFSAKKIKGKRLYDLARKGEVVERAPVLIRAEVEIVSYEYPYLELIISCSKGTYIRSIAYDLAQKLGLEGHLAALRRTKSGTFTIENAVLLDSIST